MHDNRKAIKKYFDTVPKIYVYTLLGGVVGSLIFSSVIELFLVSLATIGVSGYLVYSIIFQKPSDYEMDQWLEEDLKGLKAFSLQKTRIDITELVRESVLLYGPQVVSIGGSECKEAIGKDKKIRYSLVDILIIHFTEHQLITFQCVIDRLTGNKLNTKVKRFFYRDVVSAESETSDITFRIEELSKNILKKHSILEKQSVNGMIQLHGSESFRLTTSAGTSVSITLSIPHILDSSRDEPLETSASEAIHAVNKMLLSKKI